MTWLGKYDVRKPPADGGFCDAVGTAQNMGCFHTVGDNDSFVGDWRWTQCRVAAHKAVLTFKLIQHVCKFIINFL